MRTIISHAIPFKDVMRDLAKALSTRLYQSCEVFILRIPDHAGSGTRGINFSEGIGLLMYDCLFYEETEIQFIINEIHPLKFMFCEEGEFLHRFQNSTEVHRVEALQNIIVASDKNRGHILRFNGNLHTKINNLEVDRKRFNSVMFCEIRKLEPGLRALFQDVEGRNYFYHLGSYSLQSTDAFKEIHEFKGTAFLQNLLIHSQPYNIFFIQIIEYMDALAPGDRQSLLRKSELNLIREASLIIDSDLSRFRSVQGLSRMVGLNPNKLQNGFKEVYKTTVNEYVQHRRLNEASILIKNTDLAFLRDCPRDRGPE